MKTLTLTLGLGFLLITSSLFASDAKPVASAVDSASAWLMTIDQGQYAESWEQTDSLFQAQVTKDKWTATLKQVRSPLGDLESRTNATADEMSQLQGLPKGEYAVLTFKADFKAKKGATESVVMSKGSGQWKVIGYFIK